LKKRKKKRRFSIGSNQKGEVASFVALTGRKKRPFDREGNQAGEGGKEKEKRPRTKKGKSGPVPLGGDEFFFAQKESSVHGEGELD